MSNTMQQNSRDYQSIREKFNLLYGVFERICLNDPVTLQDNKEVLFQLIKIFSCNDDGIIDKWSEYFCNNENLKTTLIKIIMNACDPNTCKFAIELLLKHLTYTNITLENKLRLKDTLTLEPNLKNLMESLPRHSELFAMEFGQQQLQKLHGKLLRIINILSKPSHSRRQITFINNETVLFIKDLLESKCIKECCVQLLSIIKLICLKKQNTELLMSSKFFDELCNAFELTRKVLIFPTILKIMSKNKAAANVMSRHERIFDILFFLLKHSEEIKVNKKTIVTILHRLSNTSLGLEMLAKEEKWNDLLHFFATSDMDEQQRIPFYKIKIYSILNKSMNKEIVIPADTYMRGNQGNESSSEESDFENEENEDPNKQHTEETENEEYESDSTIDLEDIEDKIIKNELMCSTDLSEMKPMCRELFLDEDISTGGTLYINFNNNGRNCAYPDKILNDYDLKNDYVLPPTNNELTKHLSEKIQNIRHANMTNYYQNIVYDVRLPKFSSINQSHHTNVVPRLTFESRFECGNLQIAIQIGSQEYDLILNSDTNTTKGRRWFYFMVKNTVKETKYFFNIVNCLNVNSQFNQGMQPVVFSVTDYNLHGIGWRRAGQDIAYYGNYFVDQAGHKQLRSLTFSLIFKHSSDCVYVAYHYPYTYTRLTTMLQTQKVNPGIYFRSDNLCSTTSNKTDVPLLTITSDVETINQRPIIFLTSRVHPGESNASWIIEGIIQYLLGNEEHAIKARQNFVFKIIPMLNPEGVIFGNSRSSFTGYDLNRCWSYPHPVNHKEIYYSKRLVKYIRFVLNRSVAAFIDIHGHSRKKNFFFYGCNPNESWQKRDKQLGNLEEALNLLPKAIEKYNSGLRISFCKNVIQRNRESTCRVVMWREFDIQNSFTLECSYCALEENKAVTPSTLKEIGCNVIKGFADIA